MDSLSHALFIAIPCLLAGRPDLVPFAILGAVIPDIDVTFQRISNADPRLYIFTHGGFTHSFLGGVFTAIATSLLAIIGSYIIFPSWAPVSPGLAVAAAVAGVITHLALDFLAYPGIPLVYPISDKKYTMGIMAGPSIYLLVASIVYVILLIAGLTTAVSMWAYPGFFTVVVAVSAIVKLYVSKKTGGMAIPGLNPVKWLIIIETPCTYFVYRYDLFKGPEKGSIYQKYGNVEPATVPRAENPEYRRMRYHSYLMTVERSGKTITFRDPLREYGHVWYPPYFKSMSLSIE